MSSKISLKDTLVIYTGRFQPFHKGHHDVYRFLKDKYPNVIIGTTDTKSKDKKRYPFNFEEKMKIMLELGRIEQYDILPYPVKNPYSDAYAISYIRKLKTINKTLPPEVRKRVMDIDLNHLLVLFVVSEKDMKVTGNTKPRFIFPNNNLLYTSKVNIDGRKIPSKIQKLRYKSNVNISKAKFNNINSLKVLTDFNYILTVPTNVFRVLEKDINSATDVRNLIVSPPGDYSSVNVLESLYDTPQNSDNKDLYELIIKKIKDSYSTKKLSKKEVKSSSKPLRKVSNESPKKKQKSKKKPKKKENSVPVRRSKRLLETKI